MPSEYFILVGIPNRSDVLDYEYVYGDALRSQVLTYQRDVTDHSDLRIITISSNDFGAISDAVDALNNS